MKNARIAVVDIVISGPRIELIRGKGMNSHAAYCAAIMEIWRDDKPLWRSIEQLERDCLAVYFVGAYHAR